MIIFSLFHSPGDQGWFYCLLLDLDTRLGRSTACRFYRSREPLGLVRSGLHGESRSRSQTVLDIEFITICFPNYI